MIPGDELSKARIHQIQNMDFTGARIDIDDAREPARIDRVNWTANNAEIDHMIGKIAFTRELYGRSSIVPWTCMRAMTRQQGRR